MHPRASFETVVLDLVNKGYYFWYRKCRVSWGFLCNDLWAFMVFYDPDFQKVVIRNLPHGPDPCIPMIRIRLTRKNWIRSIIRRWRKWAKLQKWIRMRQRKRKYQLEILRRAILAFIYRPGGNLYNKLKSRSLFIKYF